MLKTTTALLLALAIAAPLAAQARRPAPTTGSSTPSISLRPFFLATGERMLARTTFDAVFGQSVEPFLGGGLEVVFRDGLVVGVAASRFKKTGERAFLTTAGNVFRLGIPLTATITPFEVSGGYRFKLRRTTWLVPYLQAGVGSYSYKETSNFNESGEDVDVRHAGYLVVGGAEIRLHRWIGVSVDAQYTHIPGILGDGGLAKDAKENDLGGVAARFRFIVGR